MAVLPLFVTLLFTVTMETLLSGTNSLAVGVNHISQPQRTDEDYGFANDYPSPDLPLENWNTDKDAEKVYSQVLEFLQGLGLDVDWKPVIELESHKNPGFWDRIQEASQRLSASRNSGGLPAKRSALPDIPPKMLKYLIENMQHDAIKVPSNVRKQLSLNLDLKTISLMMKAGRRNKYFKNIDAELKSLGK